MREKTGSKTSPGSLCPINRHWSVSRRSNDVIKLLLVINNNRMATQKWEEYPCLQPQIVKTLYKLGYDRPTAIQSEVMQNYRYYYDFLIASQTGSGKTVAFAAPIVSELLSFSNKSTLPPKIMCLVLAPTRELAQQIQRVFNSLLRDTDVRQISIFGGLSVDKQLRVLRQKNPQIVIGTPGRIQELLQEQSLDFSFLKYLVIDEADRMIQMGHYMELDKILSKIFDPKIKETYEGDFNEINAKMMKDEVENNQFFIKENGKKKKIKFNINAIATDQLFEVPMSLFAMEGEPEIKEVKPEQKKVKSKNKPVVVEPITQAQKQLIERMKRRIFFISATLTRDFKGTKYFIKKDRSKSQAKSKGKSKGKQQDKKNQQEEEDYIPKLQALMSRVKFDAKPKIIDLSSQLFLPAKLKELYCFCQDDIEKISIILCYIRDLPQTSKCIIFTNTIKASKRVKFFMDAAGLKSFTLHSHMMQKQRLDKLENFKKSSTNILISTDVAARGLDFTINNVVQFSVPINGDTYVHRVGRTARANRSGQALVLISQKQASKWEQICNIISGDVHRRAEKYRPLQSTMDSVMEKVKEYEWIRLNEQQTENKRLAKIDEMEAEEIGVEVEDDVVVKRVNKVNQEEERIHEHKIKKQISKIKQKDIRSVKVTKKDDIGDGKVWKKNKLVMSIEEIRKFL